MKLAVLGWVAVPGGVPVVSSRIALAVPSGLSLDAPLREAWTGSLRVEECGLSTAESYPQAVLDSKFSYSRFVGSLLSVFQRLTEPIVSRWGFSASGRGINESRWGTIVS